MCIANQKVLLIKMLPNIKKKCLNVHLFAEPPQYECTAFPTLDVRFPLVCVQYLIHDKHDL